MNPGPAEEAAEVSRLPGFGEKVPAVVLSQVRSAKPMLVVDRNGPLQPTPAVWNGAAKAGLGIETDTIAEKMSTAPSDTPFVFAIISRLPLKTAALGAADAHRARFA